MTAEPKTEARVPQIRDGFDIAHPPALMSPDETALFLGLGRRTLDRMPDGPPRVSVAGPKYRLTDVVDWLASRPFEAPKIVPDISHRERRRTG